MTLSRHGVMRRYLLMFGGIFLASSSLSLISLWRQRTDIWWTPPNLAVPLTESGDRVRIYLRGEPLEGVLSGARLQLAGGAGGGTVALDAKDLTLRFNNYERVRARRLASAALYGAGAGASLLSLFLGILGLSPQPERHREAKGETAHE